MEIEVVKNEKKVLEFKLKGERHTFPGLLVDKLQNSSDVEFAAYKLEHPKDKESIIVLRTKSKAPKTVLTQVNKELIK